jgi:histidyl-tRNA synthetase
MLDSPFSESSVIKAIRGTRDILPDEMPVWSVLERAAHDLMGRYGYREIRTPVFEETDLFARGIGVDTDIVTKEMYTFDDRDGSSLTLRPEATAGIVRAVIEHNLMNTDPALKVYALGPMFRRERPQKGRYRQFHQLDVEAFGFTSPTSDAEMIEIAVAYLEACGVDRHELVLNSVGDANCRPAYVETLRKALREQAPRMCRDCQRRVETNPLRVLDCKVPEDQEIIEGLPKIAGHLCAECRDHFAEVCRQLKVLGIPYRLSHRLVRGLDYYVRTTFEVLSGELGAQNSVLGGGRYDGLVHDLGGPEVAGTGFAVGLERLALLVPSPEGEGRCDVFLAPLTDEALDPALFLQRDLRQAGVRAMLDPEGRSFKSRMKQADKLGARYVAILGEDEMARRVWTVRDMKQSEQEDVPEERILEHLKEKTNG